MNKIENITTDFFEAGERDLTSALEILKSNRDIFKQESDYLEYDNYPNNSTSDKDFINSAKLDRLYKEIQFENNLETFAAMLLDHSLNYITKDIKLDVLDYLLEKREDFNIKDELIVQFLVEKYYDLNAVAVDYESHLSLFRENLEKIIFKLVDNNVSFESDTEGYLYQIIGFTEVKKQYNLFRLLVEKGSNISNFLLRYEDSSNWLTEKEESELENFDFNHDRQYNIYKKFDSINKIAEETINTCKIISNSIKLDNELENKQSYVANILNLRESAQPLLKDNFSKNKNI